MKKLLLILILLCNNILLKAEGLPAFNIQVQYIEHNGHNQNIEVTAKYHFNKSITLNTQPNIIIDDNWDLVSIDHNFNGEYIKDDEINVVFTLRHRYENLPYYPDQLYIEHINDDDFQSIRALFLIYFTPYNTTEVIGEDALTDLKRVWYAKDEISPERISIDQNSIPISDIPINFIPNDEWQTDYRTIQVPGLAYSIPMMAIHPDSIPSVLKNQGGEGEMNRMGDGCAFSKKFAGHITGNITALFRNEETPIVLQSIPLRGIDIEIVERNSNWINVILGSGQTDANGNFSVWINICRAFEGDNVELFVRIKGENEYYKIWASKKNKYYTDIEKHETPYRYWSYNNGNINNLNFGNITVFHETIKAVHLSVLAWEFSNANSGKILENNLIIKTGTNETYFFPDQSCGQNLPIYSDLLVPHPAIRLSTGQVITESTTWHEFGHFLMWQLQNKCWIDLKSGSFAEHFINTSSNSRIAWTEGWANAFMQICDANYRFIDNENFLDEDRNNYERRTIRDGITINITNGFSSEFYVACTIYDLWDGPDKFPSNTPNNVYNDDQSATWLNDTDEASLSFTELCNVVKNGDINSLPENNGKIEDIQVFFKYLTKNIQCEETISSIRQCFFRNEINNDFTATDYYFNSDILYRNVIQNYSGSAIEDPIFSWVGQYNYNHAQRINITSINSANLSYNLPYYNSIANLNQDLLISNQGTLFLNNYLPPGIQFNNTSQERPPINLTSIYEICNQSDYTVDAGGSLIIGDPSGNYTSSLVLKSGSTLLLKGNSLTRINNNSKLIIESGAHLIIELGANIEVNGTNAMLEVAGQLTLQDGVIFTREGTGFIRFSNLGYLNIEMGNNTGFNFNGSGQTDKVLEITNGMVYFPWGSGTTKKFTATNCNIVTSGNGSLNVASDLIINNVKLSGGFGLTTYGQFPVDIQNSTFHTSLTANQSGADGAPLYIKNCNFDNANLYVYDKGLTIENSNFYNNTLAAIKLENLIFPSYVKNTTFSDSYSAIDYTGNTSAPLILDDIYVYGTFVGVVAENTFIKAKCSYFNVLHSPFQLLSGAMLDLSTQNGGIYSNNILTHYDSDSPTPLIKLGNAEALFLDEGLNLFKKEYSSSKYISGTFNDNNTNIIAENNTWHDCSTCGSTTPQSTKFDLINAEIDVTPITNIFSDNSCNGGQSIMSTSISTFDILDNCTECETVKYKGENINKRLKQIFKDIANDTLSINTINNIEKLDSILNFQINGNKPKIEKLKSRAYANYIKLVQDLLLQNVYNSTVQIANNYYTKAMNTTIARLNKSISLNDTNDIKYYLLNKAYLHLYKDEFFNAITIFNNALLMTNSNSSEYNLINKQICLVTNEDLFVSGIISSTQFDSLNKSCRNISNNTLLVRTDKEIIKNEANITFDVKLSPNPANSLLNVDLIVEDSDSNFEYQIIDISGRVILTHKSINVNKFDIDISTIAEGAYFLKVTNGVDLITNKFVIIR